jgi:hypothetical protein
MATKKLSRTAIEGGRSGGNKRERRASNGPERARVRDGLRQVGRGGDDADGWTPQRRAVVDADFADKLGPARRWLRAQAGRPWEKVWSELKLKFDPRTTAGRHLVYDHMLVWVDLEGRGSWARFTVDAHGILRAIDRGARERGRHWQLWEETDRARRWMGERRVGARGGAWFWFVPSGRGEGAFRQDRRLDDAELAVWLAFSDEVRRELLGS